MEIKTHNDAVNEVMKYKGQSGTWSGEHTAMCIGASRAVPQPNLRSARDSGRETSYQLGA
jgi:hypothetical protein